MGFRDLLFECCEVLCWQSGVLGEEVVADRWSLEAGPQIEVAMGVEVVLLGWHACYTQTRGFPYFDRALGFAEEAEGTWMEMYN